MSEDRGVAGAVRERAVRGIRSVFSAQTRSAWIAAAAIAVAALALVAVGAFDAAAEAEPDPVAIGEEVRLSTYAVTVLDAEVTDAVDEQYLEADEGESLLLVTMRLENLSDRTIGVGTTSDKISSRLVNVPSPLLELSGIDDPGSARTWHDVTSSRNPLLQPDVPADITVAWTVSTADLDAHRISLDVHDAVVRTGQIILSSDVITWAQGELVARIDMGVGG